MKQDLAAMIGLARRLLASDTPGTLTTLFSACGSTYRTLGSMMVSVPGIHAGAVSGGCLEEYVARAGERATRNTAAVILRFNTHPDSGDDVPVLGCGGSIELLVERLTLDHLQLLEQLAMAHARDEWSLLAWVVERTGQSVFVAREWLHNADELSEGRPELARICETVVHEARSCHATLAHQTDVLVQYVPPVTRLVIFGAGDDAQPLCDLGASLGWHVAVVDRRARLATTARFPNAAAVLAADWDEAVAALRLTPRTSAVLMTHSLVDDARVLSLLLPKPLSYIGALGPAHRRRWLLEELEACDRRPPDDATLRLRGPVGLDLGDRSAAGIAIAVAAEILAQVNGRDGQPLHNQRRACPIETESGVSIV